MSLIIDSCPHKYEVIDQRSGDILCSECGLVLDVYYEVREFENYEERKLSIENVNYVLEIIERLNIPSSISSFIFQKINETRDGGKVTECFLARCIYITLSELSIPFSIKDISSATGINQVNISKERKVQETNNVVIIKIDDILERACSKLSLNFKDYTLIKEKLKKINHGFNPSTVVAANIFNFCKESKNKISLKKISEVIGVSCMSVQRFIKKHPL